MQFAQTRLLNIPFVFVRQATLPSAQTSRFFFIISDSILVSDDDINLFHFLILDQRWKTFFEKNLKYLNPLSKDTREVSGKKSKEIFLINNPFACHNYITLKSLNKINI